MVEETIKQLDKFLRSIADKILLQSQENLIADGKNDTLNLMRSGNTFKIPGGYKVEYSMPYSTAIEKGTDPHKVDPAELEDWVRRKLGKRGKEIKTTAFFVARSIKKRGTKGAFFLEKALINVVKSFK